MNRTTNSVQNPLVSVVITCFNLGRFLEEAVESVINQSYCNWECVIVDDGSTDNTREIAISYESKDSRITFMHKANEGVANARNIGIRRSQGEYILLLDADDKLGLDYLELAVNSFQANSNLKIVYCEAHYFGKKAGKWDLPEFSVEELLKNNMIFVSALFRKVDYDKTKGFRSIGFEDWDFWLSFIDTFDGIEVLKIKKVCFYYRIRSDSKFITDGSAYFDNCLDIYNNHKNLYTRYGINPIYQFGYVYTVKKTDYQLGHLLISPLRTIYRFGKRIINYLCG